MCVNLCGEITKMVGGRAEPPPIHAAGQRPDISDDADIIEVQARDGEDFCGSAE